MTHLPDFLTLGRASCTSHDPDLFTTCTPANVQQAKPICAACPLRTECMTWALDNQEPVGVWGGLTPSERVQVRHGDGWWADDDGRIRVPCGTVEALGAHRGYGETCQTCEAAEAATIAAQRQAALAREHSRPRGGSRRGHELHQLLGEEPCPPCVQGARMSAAIRAAKSRGKTGRAARAAEGLAIAS